MTFFMVTIAMIVEWLGIYWNHAAEWTRIPHAVVKCLDYIATPMAGICFLNQVTGRTKFPRIIWGVNTFNVIFEVISIFTGWTFYIDENNVYQHGPYYFVYIVLYLVIFITVFIEFVEYGKQFKKRNLVSLYSIIGTLLVSIIVQNVFDFRIVYIVISFATLLLFVHFTEFSQQLGDDKINYQKKLLETDALTGLYSRYAYSEEIEKYEEKGVPDNMVAFSIDINGLKGINDTLGHLAGDELIKGGAECISDIFSEHGKCFRTGGDEFIVLLAGAAVEIEQLHERFRERYANWHGQLAANITMSSGYAIASDFKGYSIEKLIAEADKKMYADKDSYYQNTGLRRRS